MKSFAFSLALALGLAPSVLHAQQLRQPESVLPWKPRTAQLRIAQAGPTTPVVDQTPSWLQEESAKPLPAQSSPRADLPMVEPEGFVELGELEVSSLAAPRTSAQQNSTAPASSFGILRAFGFGSTQQR